MMKITTKEYRELEKLLYKKSKLGSLLDCFNSEYLKGTMTIARQHSVSSIDIESKDLTESLARMTHITDQVDQYTQELLKMELALVELEISKYIKSEEGL